MKKGGEGGRGKWGLITWVKLRSLKKRKISTQTKTEDVEKGGKGVSVLSPLSWTILRKGPVFASPIGEKEVKQF